MSSDETVNAAIAFGPDRRKLVQLAEIVRKRSGEIETGRFASLRQEEITLVAFDPIARLQAEGMTYRFVVRRDGSFKAKRRD